MDRDYFQGLQDIPNDIKAVYLIRSGVFLKIGIASQLRTRYKSIKTDCPYGCELIGYIKCEKHRELEKKLHEQFKQYHHSGEWYIYREEIIRTLADKQRDNIVFFGNYKKYKQPTNKELEEKWRQAEEDYHKELADAKSQYERDSITSAYLLGKSIFGYKAPTSPKTGD